MIIMSDIHLGSEACEAKEVMKFLESIGNSSLILNGDTFESLNFARFKKIHWEILSKLREMKAIWIVGNHEEPGDILSCLIGLPVLKEYEFISGGKKILVTHGHSFDKFLNKHAILTWIGDCIYRFFQKIDRSHRIAQAVKHSSKNYTGCLKYVRKKAIELAKRKNCDIVICGHTHHPEIDIADSVHYYNSGCWTEKPCSYLTVEDGKIEVKYFNSKTDLKIKQ